MSKRTKIVATVGPSTSSEEVLKAMIKEGVNVFRVNFSHGIHQDHINAIKKIRTVDEQLGTHSAILADLQGPKIRIGDMPEKGLLLENNQDSAHCKQKKVKSGRPCSRPRCLPSSWQEAKNTSSSL